MFVSTETVMTSSLWFFFFLADTDLDEIIKNQTVNTSINTSRIVISLFTVSNNKKKYKFQSRKSLSSCDHFNKLLGQFKSQFSAFRYVYVVEIPIITLTDET